MIHIAPCSCELHVRIRELEAELNDEMVRHDWAREDWEKLLARAEKAEARVAELSLNRRDGLVVPKDERCVECGRSNEGANDGLCRECGSSREREAD